MWAAWCGLVGGILEVIVLGLERYALGLIIRVGPHVVWMAPLANAVAFAALGIVVTAVGRWWPRLAPPRPIVVAFAALATLGVTLPLGGVHPLAKLVAAVGIGVAVGRWSGLGAARARLLVTRTTPILAGLVAASGLLVSFVTMLGESRRIAVLPPAPAGAPNVVLLVLDTERASRLALYGYGRPTSPALERLAASSVVFDRAYSTAPWTLPAHGSLLTGRYAHELSTGWRSPLDRADPTLAEVLAAHGYVTGAFVANLVYLGAEFGLARGFGRYEDYQVSPIEMAMSAALVRKAANMTVVRRVTGFHDIVGRKRGGTVTSDFFRWVDGHDGARPFFAFLNYFDAHDPYLPPAPYDTLYGALRERALVTSHYFRHANVWGWFRPDLSPAALAAEQAGYDAALTYLDAQVGTVVDGLAARGLLDRTVFIVVSDHGEQFGEHGKYRHGNSLYAEELHVPLLVRYPLGAPAGRRVSVPVSLRDLPATVLDLTGVGAALPGASLARAWGDSGGAVSPVLATLVPVDRDTPIQSLVVGRYHYITDGGREELYDVIADAAETTDLAGAAALAAVLTAARADLRRLARTATP